MSKAKDDLVAIVSALNDDVIPCMPDGNDRVKFITGYTPALHVTCRMGEKGIAELKAQPVAVLC